MTLKCKTNWLVRSISFVGSDKDVNQLSSLRVNVELMYKRNYAQEKNITTAQVYEDFKIKKIRGEIFCN